MTRLDILIALSQEGYDRFAKDTVGCTFFDTGRVKPDLSLKMEHFSVTAEEMAQKELGKKMAANLISIAACCAKTGIISKEFLIKALQELIEGSQRPVNIKALELGWELGIKAVAHV